MLKLKVDGSISGVDAEIWIINLLNSRLSFLLSRRKWKYSRSSSI